LKRRRILYCVEKDNSVIYRDMDSRLRGNDKRGVDALFYAR
jgi:hypothetical protein